MKLSQKTVLISIFYELEIRVKRFYEKDLPGEVIQQPVKKLKRYDTHSFLIKNASMKYQST